jgi:endoglucanase
MFKVKKISFVAAGLLLTLAVSCVSAKESKAADPFEQNKRLGRGINLGNALEAPEEGEWGVTLKEEYFKIIKDAGFDSVRIPCRWSIHALKDEPYTIEPNFFDRVDWAIENAQKNGLYVMLNVHHYNVLMEDPNGHRERLLGLWKQIAEHYKDYPQSLLFEPLNEPKEKLTAELWNDLLKKALAVVRKSNPHRTVVIGPAGSNAIHTIRRLEIPEDDQNIIVSVHYYEPSQFTHQGAGWVEQSERWLGTTWTGDERQKREIKYNFKRAADWAKKHNRPVNLGEFGAYEKADMDSRAAWTACVAKTAVENGWSFHYWEFCSGFGAYDQETNTWKEPLLKALIPSDK